MCEDCIYREYPTDNNKRNPCNHCIYWGEDGYLEYREYKNIYLLEIRESEGEK